MYPSALSINVAATFDASLPVLPHSLGVAADIRFLSAAGVVADPTTGVVSSWTDLDGGLTLKAKSGGGGTHTLVGDKTTIRYAGRASNGLEAPVSMARPHSMAVAFWIGALPAEAATVVGGRDAWARIDPANGLVMSASSPNGGFGAIKTGWTVFVATFSATTTTVRLSGVETTRDIGTAPRTTLHIGSENNGLYPLRGAIGEIALWDRALTATERASVETAMKGVWA